ncbi:ACP S-malonyltransferase [Hydrogenovibrio marinus]|nr:ACP S-malonyltransferase [Hydrogenovibrio marinus]
MSYAFVFPGQGSQSIGMMADMAAHYPIVKSTFEEASDALGYDLWQVTQDGPEEKLNQTDVTQPAMLTAGIATYRVLEAVKNVAPAYMAGHSLGEYTALVAAGVLDIAQGVKLVETRGRLMQAAVPAGEGAMAAILGLEDQQIIDICAKVDGVVEAVNFNSPGQVVIAGAKAAVDTALPLFEEAGAKRVVPLAVSVPSHCSLMKPAADALSETLAAMEFNAPSVPVIHNASVQSFSDAAAIKQALVEQLYRPVQWVKTVEVMKANGVEKLFELGPGKVLMGLNRRIDKGMGIMAVYDADSVAKALEAL